MNGKKEYTTKEGKKEHTTEIFEYIKKRHKGINCKIGVIFGTTIRSSSNYESREKEIIRIGWSLCNYRDGDKFDSKNGLEIAKRRALGDETILNSTPKMPESIKRQVRGFGSRCVRYFQDAKGLEMPWEPVEQ